MYVSYMLFYIGNKFTSFIVSYIFLYMLFNIENHAALYFIMLHGIT